MRPVVTVRQRWTLVAAILGSSIVFLDSTVVNVALPRIGRDLPSSILGVLEGQSYVYNGYLLTLSALLVLAGALSDFYGRKRMFTLGLWGFLVTSVLCGLAPSMELLVAFRILQGMAGALLVPGSLALLTVTFSGEAQGRAFGLWAAASGATTILGPFVGGMLVDSISWRAAFLINVPLLVVAVWATARHVEESRAVGASRRFDRLGALVVAVAVGGLSFGTIYGQQREWRDPLGFALLGVGAVATVALPFLMAHRRDPLIPLELFRSRNFTVTNASTFLIYGALYVVGYFLTLFLQGTIGFSAAAAGLGFVPPSLFLVFLSSRAGGLAGRYGPRLFMAAGPAIMALGILWYARIPATTSAWRFAFGEPATYLPPPSFYADILPGALLFGFGLSIMVAPLTTALMTSVPATRSGLASAINNAISRVGPQLAGAVIFVAITTTFYAGLHDRIPTLQVDDPTFRKAVAPLDVRQVSENQTGPAELFALLEAERGASTDAFHLAMLVSAGLLLAGAAVNAFGIQDRAALAAGSGPVVV